MNSKKMADKIRKDSGLQEALDEIIIDRYSTLASDLNNQGPEAQLKWLKSQGAKEDIEAIFALIQA